MGDQLTFFDLIELRKLFRIFRNVPTILTAFPFDASLLIPNIRLLHELSKKGAPVEEILSSKEWRRDSAELIGGWIAELDIRFDTFEEVLCPSGYMVDSKDVLAILQVQSDYKYEKKDTEFNSLRWALDSGHKPHIDIIKKLPLNYFDHPGYLAPAEDLLDYFGVEFYSGSKGGIAEDGAIGWLCRQLVNANQDKKTEAQVLSGLSGCLEYWEEERLKFCIDLWDSEIGPLLCKRE